MPHEDSKDHKLASLDDILSGRGAGESPAGPAPQTPHDSGSVHDKQTQILRREEPGGEQPAGAASPAPWEEPASAPQPHGYQPYGQPPGYEQPYGQPPGSQQMPGSEYPPAPYQQPYGQQYEYGSPGQPGRPEQPQQYAGQYSNPQVPPAYGQQFPYGQPEEQAGRWPADAPYGHQYASQPYHPQSHGEYQEKYGQQGFESPPAGQQWGERESGDHGERQRPPGHRPDW